MTTLLEIGMVIRDERKRRKLLQKDVAAAARIHRNTLVDLEAGKANVELNTLIAVCAQLDLVLCVVPKEVSAMVAAGNDVQQSALSTLINEKLGVQPKT